MAHIDLHCRTIFNILRNGVITSLFACDRKSPIVRIAIPSIMSCSINELNALEGWMESEVKYS